jgi:hypothetical protein
MAGAVRKWIRRVWVGCGLGFLIFLPGGAIDPWAYAPARHQGVRHK